MLWTLVLVAMGVTGLWLAVRSWWGWVITACSEVLWFVYATSIGATPLAVMACIWLAVNIRNAIVSRKEQT